jgi:signal transduction histidine kinase
VNSNPTAWERLKRVDARIWDGLLASAVVVNAQLDLWMARDIGSGVREPDLLGAAILVAATAPLYARRRRPLATAAVVAAAVFAFGTLYHPATETILSLVVAAYSIAAYRQRSAGQTIALVALMVASAVSWSDRNANWVEMASNAFFTVGVPFAFGRIVWNRHRRLDRDREVAAHDAVALERSRIARELHDVVAHSMSVMVVQAGAARAVLRRDPDETERALSAIEESGRIGLAEMRRLLSSDGETAPSLAPQPGLERLDELLARMRATGLEVELVIEGEARPLAAGVDLSAYRIVQEALTNSLKHGGDGVHARVRLRYREDGIDVEVTDDGRGPSPGMDGSGRGLIGMRERVAFLGGELHTGARPAGGFIVHARIPVAADGAASP